MFDDSLKEPKEIRGVRLQEEAAMAALEVESSSAESVAIKDPFLKIIHSPSTDPLLTF